MAVIFDRYQRDTNVCIGHSYGCRFCLWLSRNRPNVTNLVLLSGGAPVPLRTPGTNLCLVPLTPSLSPCLSLSFILGLTRSLTLNLSPTPGISLWRLPHMCLCCCASCVISAVRQRLYSSAEVLSRSTAVLTRPTAVLTRSTADAVPGHATVSGSLGLGSGLGVGRVRVSNQ